MGVGDSVFHWTAIGPAAIVFNFTIIISQTDIHLYNIHENRNAKVTGNNKMGVWKYASLRVCLRQGGGCVDSVRLADIIYIVGTSLFAAVWYGWMTAKLNMRALCVYL